jgi:hypothetical protein
MQKQKASKLLLTDFTSGKESFEALIQSRGAKPWL